MARKPRATVYKRVAISRKKKTSYARSGRVPIKFRRYVMRTLHNNAENKHRVNYGVNQSLTVGYPSSQTLPVILGCLQGTDDQTRNGNQIRITGGIWKGTFNLLPYNATTNPYNTPVWVKLWVVKDLRVQGQQATMDTVSWAKLFRVGNASMGLQYNPMDLAFDINRDQFRLLTTRTFKLGCSSAITQTPIVGTSFLDTSPASKQVTINYGKYIKKQLKFDDNISQYPSNANIYIVMQAVPCDGTQIVPDKALVEYHYVNTMKFEDL